MDPISGGLSVLVVDDEDFARTVTARLMKRLGFDAVEQAANGTEAIEAIERSSSEFDVIVCDLRMPDMDGIEFMRHLANRNVQTGLLIASAVEPRVLQTTMELAAAHGLRVLGALSKPLTAEAVRASVSKLGPVTANKRHAMRPPIEDADLRRAIEACEFVVYYQPKVEIATRRFDGVEALVRWQHPEGDLIGPDAFIPLAEECGLIEPLTDHVLQTAIAQCAEWSRDGLPVKMAMNLSVGSLRRLELPEMIFDLVASGGLETAQIMIEVTESRVMEDIVTSLEILTRLRMKGFGLSIDDFGTGYSSMAQLKRVPFTEMKIDRAFVCGAAEDAAARAILESSVDLARKLDIAIVAEGVETQADWDLVASLGCHLVQGYFVAKPMPASEIRAWAKNWARDGRAYRCAELEPGV